MIIGSIDIDKANNLIRQKYQRHLNFVEERKKNGKEVKYDNEKLNCKVMTDQKTDLVFHYLKGISLLKENVELCFESTYYLERKIKDTPPTEHGSLFFCE